MLKLYRRAIKSESLGSGFSISSARLAWVELPRNRLWDRDLHIGSLSVSTLATYETVEEDQVDEVQL